MTRVVIAAADPTALRTLVDREEGFEVVAEAGDVAGAHRYVRGHHPDVLVLDLDMPGDPVLPAMRALREECPGTSVVVLAAQEDPAVVRRVLQEGASAFVLRQAADEQLVQAVRAAARGDTFLDPQLGARVAVAQPEPARPPDDLTDREVEVLRLIALGHTNSEIAGRLHLSVRTVESHRAHIQQKLRLTSRAELVRYALDHGWLPG